MISTKIEKNKGGFSLIELLVVISIIGVLAGLALVSLQGSRQSARDGKRKADLEQVRTALEIYRSDMGAYPNSLGDLVTDYLPATPTDPLSSTRQYAYEPNLTDDTYTLCAALETGSGSISDCSSGCGENCNYAVYSPNLAPTPTPGVD